MLNHDSDEHEELEMRVKKLKTYETIFNALVSYWFLVITTYPLENYFARSFFHREPNDLEGWLSLFIGATLWLSITYVMFKKVRKYRLEDDEWARFYTYSILTNLEKYSKTNNIEMKRNYRKKAVKDAKDFVSLIEKKWKVGTFKLARDYCGRPLSEFKGNLHNRIVPNLKEGNDELLGKVEQIMRNFFSESKSLTMDSINKLNEQMRLRLEEKGIKPSHRESLMNFFRIHRIVRHGFFVLTLTIGCSVFYYIAVGYLQIVKEYAFTGSVAIFLGLLTMYFARKPKE